MRKPIMTIVITLALFLGVACRDNNTPEVTIEPPTETSVTEEITPVVAITETPMLMCTPPACAANEVYACDDENGCPGGCGTICLLPTPVPAATTVTPMPDTLLPAPEGDWEALAIWLGAAWHNQANPAAVRAALQAAAWQEDDADWRGVDLDGDLRDEWAVTLHEPGEEGAAFGHYGRFWIVNQAGVIFRYPPADEPSFGLAADIIGTADMTGDGLPELVIDEHICGASTCYGNYLILSGANDGVLNLVASEMMSSDGNQAIINMSYPDTWFADYGGDGRFDFFVHGGQQGSAGAGITRTYTEIWGWDGTAVSLLDKQWDPTPFRHHILYEANDAYAAGDLAWASLLYEKAINDTLLDDEVFFGTKEETYAAIAQFAAFRLILIDLRQNDRPRATSRLGWMGRNYPGTPLTQAAGSLIASWTDEAGLTALCSQLDTFLETFAQPTGVLTDLGYGNPSLGAADVCP